MIHRHDLLTAVALGGKFHKISSLNIAGHRLDATCWRHNDFRYGRSAGKLPRMPFERPIIMLSGKNRKSMN
jgi:hypothetical protein